MRKTYKAKWILPANGKVLENAVISIENGKITSVLENSSDVYFENCIDYKNAVITPGFINLHTHLQYTNFALPNEKTDFAQWIIGLIDNYAALTEQEKIKSLKQGLKQAILYGTTSLVQLSKESFFFEILKNAPLNAYIFLEAFADSEFSAKENFDELIEILEKLKHQCSDTTFVGVSPHSIYTAHIALWDKISRYAKNNDILVHSHFAESQDELEFLKKGKSKLDLVNEHLNLKKIDFNEGNEIFDLFCDLNENLTLAHCNQLNLEKLQKLSDAGVNLAYCPRSNMFLHNKTHDFIKLLRIFKNKVGFGTDSLYSNNDLNLLNEARFALDFANSKNIDSASPVLDVLKILDMLTINSAKILKIDNQTGSLELGKNADFLVFRLDQNESWHDFINKQQPDDVYFKGEKLVENQKLVCGI